MSIYAKHARRSQRTMQQHYALRRFLTVWSVRIAKHEDLIRDACMLVTGSILMALAFIGLTIITGLYS